MLVDAVFAGGGVRAIAFAGALEEMVKRQIYVKRAAGTSAGALTAALIIAGYKPHELNAIIYELKGEELLDARPQAVKTPWLKWMQVYKYMGLYKGNALEKWIADKLKKKGIRTFGDVEKDSLKIVGSDLTNGRFIVFPDDLADYGIDPDSFPIARAIRMSCSLPFFFEPVLLRGKKGNSWIVDGGVLSNFPMWLFENRLWEERKRPVIGMQLVSNKTMEPAVIDNGLQLLQAIIETMRRAHDQRYVDEAFAKNVIFIPVADVKATAFSLTEKERLSLFLEGEKAAKEFLVDKNWL
ncbi:patatin-like phospholipase family protein [Paenalkalicoccus suaedae]|uniref:Patatin-like phospholipase family protein n=1 Tax=Paenalkalicoccus suaedae TaxID=2592382 RepID=A0A859FFG1_9BACI|nr:patatin-like phospholipase family protein [Paenalkalicoccus suaedae]QKS70945.1 patatin-like phospholipase family protein [Paenalkalicoccus suaedae]